MGAGADAGAPLTGLALAPLPVPALVRGPFVQSLCDGVKPACDDAGRVVVAGSPTPEAPRSDPSPLSKVEDPGWLTGSS